MTKMAVRAFYVALPFLLIGLVYGTFEIAYLEKSYPNIRIAGMNVGNKSQAEIHNLLSSGLSANNSLLFTWGTSRWEIPVTDIGLVYDPQLTAFSAYQIGRSGNWPLDMREKFSAWYSGRSLPVQYIYDEDRLTEVFAKVSSQIDIPAQEPEIAIVNQQIVVSRGVNGQIVDEQLFVERVRNSIATQQFLVEIPVKRLEPQISESQVEQVRTRGEALLGKTLSLSLDDQTWQLSSEQIISWINPGPPTGGESWKRELIAKWVDELAVTVDRPAQNAHFQYVNSRVEEFSPAKEGLVINKPQLVDELMVKLGALVTTPDSLSLEIPADKTQPDVTTDQVNNLGIRELIGRGESNFTGSITNRIFNLKLAASRMNGILVAPGETFSFNKYIGDISSASGYKQAYIIQNGRTILGDGGGVCQVSTTMFRAAINAGLPIEERNQHAYRVTYYENDRQPGFDAAIFTPTQDFKFKNDTPAYILIQTIYDETKKSLAFEFYGTKDGRAVEISKARVWDTVPPPPPLYQDDPELPAGTEKQVDWSAWGAKAAFDYKVTRNGEVLQERTFYSNYRAWQAVYLRGTKV